MNALRDQVGFSVRATATLGLMIVCALTALCVSVGTAFRSRRFCSERLVTPFGRCVLRVWGIRMRVHRESPLPPGQAVYISNHTSTIDVFVLVALGLPNARYFLSGFLRKLPPLALIGYLIGIFWTAPQADPARRTRIFQRAERVLRRSGESVYLSPEGERVTSGGIGAFNKGAFHLATTLGAPIVPLFILIPKEIDPGRGLRAGSGSVDVFVRSPIETKTWRIEDLITNKERIRDYYLEWHRSFAH
jgi:1-acyl-sn-glycerol-3-phosphate acyltransferase